jgi:signal transduction histidine kinase
MDPDIEANLFQRFFSTKGTQGTGFGLMLTKKIIDLHNGKIEVRTERGEGSTFIMRLPRAPADF